MGIVVDSNLDRGAQAWKLDVALLFENENDPNATAEFSAEFDMFGSPAVHPSSQDTVEDFMVALATAISDISGRICHVTLSKATVANDQLYST